MIAVTASRLSTLGAAAQITIELGQLDEACSLGLAPSTSTTAMLALGDALSLVVSKLKGFRAEDFAKYHPGGALGRKLSHVEDHMRPLAECRVARVDATLREVLVSCTKPGRRTGAIMLVDAKGKLTGLFTDSDLARLIERRHDDALDRPVSELMIAHPQTVPLGAKLTVAIDILSERKISELPVVDEAGKPVGLVDVTDLVGLLPDQTAIATPPDGGPTIMRIYPVDQYAD
jgi:arabinose-5-phosphate isomerase